MRIDSSLVEWSKARYVVTSISVKYHYRISLLLILHVYLWRYWTKILWDQTSNISLWNWKHQLKIRIWICIRTVLGVEHKLFVHSRWAIYGITSFGEGCGAKGKYGIYVKLANYRKWLRLVIRRYTNQRRARRRRSKVSLRRPRLKAKQPTNQESWCYLEESCSNLATAVRFFFSVKMNNYEAPGRNWGRWFGAAVDVRTVSPCVLNISFPRMERAMRTTCLNVFLVVSQLFVSWTWGIWRLI